MTLSAVTRVFTVTVKTGNANWILVLCECQNRLSGVQNQTGIFSIVVPFNQFCSVHLVIVFGKF